jgi:hypothetical protein
MALSVGDLAINVTTEMAQLITGLSSAADHVNRFATTAQRAFDRVNGAFAAIGVGVSLGGLIAGVKSVIDYADRLNDLSKQTGIAVETLGGLGYAASTAGVQLEDVAKGSQKLAQLMAEAAGGGAKAQSVFSAMGVSATNLTGGLRPLDEALFDVADKFASYADGPAKAALAQELFGKSGAALIPLLDEGGAKLREMVAEYQKYAGITKETAERADVFNDSVARIKLIGGALFREIAANLLPTLQAIVNVFVDAKTKGDGFKGAAEGITTAVKLLGIAGIGVVEAFKAVGTTIGAVFAAFGQAITGDFKGALATLKLGFSDVGTSIATAIERAKTVWNASTADMAASALRATDKMDAPIVRAQGAVDKLAKELDKLEAQWHNAFAGNQAGVSAATVKSLEELDRLLGAGRISQEEYVRGLGIMLDADKVFADEQKQLNDTLSAFYKLVDDIDTAIAPSTDAFVRAAEAMKSGTDSLNQQNEQLRQLNATFGLSEAAAIAFVASEQRKAVAASNVADILKQQRLAAIDANETEKLIALTNKGIEEQRRGWTELFDSITDRGARFITDFVEHGSSAFRNLWEDFKHWAIEALAKIAAQKIVVSIAGALGLGGVASNAAASVPNPWSLLTGGGAPAAGLYGSFATSAAGQFLGLSEVLAGPATAAGELSVGLTAAGVALGTMIPVVGLVVAALAFFGKDLFKSGGPKTQGSALTAYDAAGAFTGLVPGGADIVGITGDNQELARAQDLGKTIANGFYATLKQLGGTAGALDIGVGFSTDPQGDAPSFVHTIVRDAAGEIFRQFNDQVGRSDQALQGEIQNQAQRAILAALQASDLPDYLSGLLDTVNASTAPLEAITHVLETATAVANVVNTFGESFASLTTLDPTKVTGFVDALGGAQAFFNAFAFLDANFRTEAERIAQATQDLTAGFARLGLEIPKTHAAFLKLIDAAIAVGDTDLAASLTQLAPLFVRVAGTADQAAQAVTNLADSAGDAAKDIQAAADVIFTSTKQIVDAGKSKAAELLDTVRELAGASTGGFGDKLGIQIDLIRDALDKAGAIRDPRGGFRLIGGTQADKIYVSELAKSYTQFAGELARFTVLSAQFDAARAEQLVGLEEWFAEQQKIFGKGTAQENVAALTALGTIFDQKWRAIVDGVSSGVDGTLDQLGKLRQGIAEYLQKLVVSDVSPLTPREKLETAQTAFDFDIAKAFAGDRDALSRVTSDFDNLLRVAEEAYAHSQPFQDIFNAGREQLARLAGTTATGLPLPDTQASADAAAVAALEQSLPDGRIASQDDIERNTEATERLRHTMVELFGASISATQGSDAETRRSLDRLIDAQRRLAVQPR